MNSVEHVIHYLEELKIPIDSEYSPEDWKDWYHYVLMDPDDRIKLLFNISFSGRQKLGDITVTVQMTTQDSVNPNIHRNYGFLEVLPWEKKPSQRLPLELSIPGLLEIDLTSKYVNAVVQHSNQNFELTFKGEPRATPIMIPELFPYGTGFIGWGFIPGLMVSGHLSFNNQVYTISKDWFCYHDHNFGRFRWGDENVGWVWWVASLKTNDGKSLTFVFHRGNNKDFSRLDSPYLFVYYDDELVKAFLGQSININFSWTEKPERLPILPGSMATVFSHRKVLVPNQIHIIAKDDVHDAEVTMDVEGITEIILPDYQEKQYTFIKEMNGRAKASCKINHQKIISEKGSFYAEYVH